MRIINSINSFIWTADGFNQFYPVLCYTSQWLRKCFIEKTFLQFDFTVGIGEGVIPILNMYGFGDPFLLFSAFIPDNMMPFYASFLVILKIYISGISFSIYCLYKGKKRWCILAGSLIYSFSSYSLCYGLQFWYFLMPIITFPLLILGIDMLLKEDKKVPIFLVIAAFLQATCGFYFLYMEIIFGILYFLVSYFYDKKMKGGIFSFVRITLVGISAYLVGLCMAGVLLVPSIIAFFSSTRSGDKVQPGILYESSKYLQSLQNLIIPRAFEDVLGISVLVLIAIYFTIRNKYCLKYKTILIVLIIGLVLPAFGYVMNGFSYTTDRWTFIMQFFFGVITVDVLDENYLIENDFNVFYIMIMPVVLCLLHMISREHGSVFRGLIYILLSLFLMLVIYKIRRNEWEVEGLLFFVILNLFLNLFMIFGPEKLGGSGFRAGFKTFEEVDKELSDNPVLEVEDSNTFYRMDIMSSSRGEAMILDYYGTAEYFSMINKNIYDFYNGMMVSPGMGASTWVLKNLDGRIILDSLLSVKYIEDFQQDNLRVGELRENSYYLPLGYVYTKYIDEEDFLKYNPMERQEIMLEAVIINNKIEAEDSKQESYNPKSFAYESIDYSIEYKNIDRDDEMILVNNQSSIIFRTDVQADGENYIYLEGIKTDFDIGEAVKLKIGNKEVELPGKGVHDVMINIGTSNCALLEFSKEGIYEIKKICMYHLPDDYIKEPINKLRQNSLKNIEIDGNVIRGEINSKIDGILFLSIPYGDGWEARIDGEITDIKKANLGFMAVTLKQGKHDIEFYYTTPGLKIGVFLTLGGWLFIMGFIIKRSKIREK